MIITVEEVLKDALGLIHVIEMDETPTASEYSHALRVCNTMLGRWATQRLLLRSTLTISFPLIVGKSSYTIAPSAADITSIKPINIASAYLRDSNGFDTPLEAIPVDLYDTFGDKTSPGKPRYIAYEPGLSQQTVSTGSIYLYNSPDQVYNVFMSTDAMLDSFVNLTDTVTFDATYYEALIYNLAIRLFRYYRDATMPVPQDIIIIASNSLNNLKTMNSSIIYAECDIPSEGSGFNIYTDGN